MTIVRGIAVSDLIGRTHYGAINGALTVPTTVAKALAPAVAAALWSAAGDPVADAVDDAGERPLGTVGFVLALAGDLTLKRTPAWIPRVACSGPHEDTVARVDRRALVPPARQ